MDVPPSSDTTTNVPPTPQSVADIPGLGPIRIRALQKAGWTNLKKLREAKVEALCATVPGLTPIKAKYILDYLAQFQSLPAKPPKPPNAESTEPIKEVVSGANPLLRLCVDVLYRISMLTIALMEEEVRPKLLREIKQITGNVDILAYAKELTAEQQDRAEGCLLGICHQIDDSTKHKLNRKTQGDLTENLAPYSAVLDSLVQ